MQPKEPERSIQFMSDSSQWIAMRGNVCPLKHTSKKHPGMGSMPLTGFLTKSTGFTVHIGVMFSFEAAEQNQLPQEKYNSPEDILAAGWIVD